MSYHQQVVGLIAQLMAQPMSYDEIAVSSGLSRHTVSLWIEAMREAKMVYVAEWRLDSANRPMIAVFAWGQQPDVIRQTMTAAERMAKHRASKK